MKELYVIGPARSGTTFLHSVINCSPDIFLFGELNSFALRTNPSLYAARGGVTWAEHFNNRKMRRHDTPHKGNFIPDAGRARSVDELFSETAAHYAIVGEKIALLDRKIENVYLHDLLLTEHLARHFHAWHFLTLREPVSVLLSTRHLFKNRTDSDILRGLILTYRLMLRILQQFPRVAAFFYEEMADVKLDAIFTLLGVPVPMAALPVFHPPEPGRHADFEPAPELKRPLRGLCDAYALIRKHATQRAGGIAFGVSSAHYTQIQDNLEDQLAALPVQQTRRLRHQAKEAALA